jgi:hypothetical protein
MDAEHPSRRPLGLMAAQPNHAAAYVSRGRALIAIGRAAEAMAPVEKAIRLSPRDLDLFIWY